MMKESVCVVCKKPGSKLCGSADCAAKWAEYKKPRPEHSKLEREAAHAKYGQSDRARTDDDTKTRGKPA